MKYIHPCYKGMTKNIKISCIQNKKQLKREGSVCLKANSKVKVINHNLIWKVLYIHVYCVKDVPYWEKNVSQSKKGEVTLDKRRNYLGQCLNVDTQTDRRMDIINT